MFERVRCTGLIKRLMNNYCNVNWIIVNGDNVAIVEHPTSNLMLIC